MNKSFSDQLVYDVAKNNILLTQDIKQTIRKEEKFLYNEHNVIVFFFDKNKLSNCGLIRVLTSDYEEIKNLSNSSTPTNYYYNTNKGKFQKI